MLQDKQNIDAVLLDKQKVEMELSNAEAKCLIPESNLVSNLSLPILPSMHAAWPFLWADHPSLQLQHKRIIKVKDHLTHVF